jgi:hypothetical protein
MSDENEKPKVKLGGKEFVLYEFSWRDLKRFLPKLRSVRQIDFTNFEEADLDKLTDLIFEVVTRPNPDDANYALITRDDFEKLPITLKQMLEAMPSIFKQLGVEPAKPGETPAESLSPSTS